MTRERSRPTSGYLPAADLAPLDDLERAVAAAHPPLRAIESVRARLETIRALASPREIAEAAVEVQANVDALYVALAAVIDAHRSGR